MRISEWAKKFGVRVEREIVPAGHPVYRIKDIFTTRDGSWEPASIAGSIPQWARDAYLTKEFDDAGAATHLFGAVMRDGVLIPGETFFCWTHAYNKNHTWIRSKKHGWANLFMSASSNFVPERGEVGPWAWQPITVPGDTVIGGGLPNRWHVSTFAVWEYTVEPGEPDDGGGTDPGDQPLAARVALLEQTTKLLSAEVKLLKQLLGQWVGD